MESLLAARQTMTQNTLALEAVKMAVESQRQMVALLSQAAEAGKTVNPPHLGQQLDTHA
jgi:hypothetical protein